MKRDERNLINLLSYGIDSDIAEKLIANGYNLTKLRVSSIDDLSSIFERSEAQRIKNSVSRKQIPEDTIKRLIYECDWKCCICWDVDEVKPVIVHHITEYSKTQDNSYDNLIVLCPNHHAEAHGKSDLTGDLLPVALLLKRKADFTEAIRDWKSGKRLAPGRENVNQLSESYKLRLNEFLDQKSRVLRKLKKAKNVD